MRRGKTISFSTKWLMPFFCFASSHSLYLVARPRFMNEQLMLGERNCAINITYSPFILVDISTESERRKRKRPFFSGFRSSLINLLNISSCSVCAGLQHDSPTQIRIHPEYASTVYIFKDLLVCSTSHVKL